MLFYFLGVIGLISMLLIFRLISTKMDQKCALWKGFEPLVISKVNSETNDIMSFCLKRKRGGPFPEFMAGQFLAFRIDDNNVRNYSICSSGVRRDDVMIAVKKIDGGCGSTWFHERKVGDQVHAFPPTGKFILESKKDVVLIAGGIGITPILSMAKSLIDSKDERNIYLFYGARSEKDFAFDQHLKDFARQRKNFSYIPVASQAGESWQGKRGRISLDLIKQHLKINEVSYYLCGPAPLLESMIIALKAEGVADINYERFVTKASDDLDSQNVRVCFNNKDYQYSDKENLLEFLESMGEKIEYFCRAGVCGTCRCMLEKGEVTSEEASGLTQNEIEDGYILCCVSHPITDIEIKL